MVWIMVGFYTILTIASVILGLKKRNYLFLGMPIIAIFAFGLYEIIMVPLPFWETVQFIFGLR